MAWFNLSRGTGPWGLVGSGSRRTHRAAVLGAPGAEENPRVALSTQGWRRERAGLGWSLLGEEWGWQVWGKQQSAPNSPLFPPRSKTAQVQPSPPLLCYSSPSVSVSVSEKNRRVDVFRVGFFIFSRECFCYLPVPCEASHAAPTAAELLFFTSLLLLMGDRPEPGSELGC